MAPQRTIDPEVTGLLQQIALTERSELFEVTARQLARSPVEDVPRASAVSSLLTAAERRLLETRREELGQLLYWYAWRVRTADPRLARSQHSSVSVDRELEPPAEAALAARAQYLGTRGELGADAEDPLACLRACLGGGARSAERVIVAALRVAPSDSARMCLGADLYAAGRRASSRRVLRDLLESRPAALVASYALEELGFQACAEGRYREASALYREAAEADESRIMPAVLWLFAAVQAGDARAASRAAAAVDALVGPDHSSIRWFVRGHAAERMEGGWEPTQAAAACLAALDQVGPASREILHVFA